MLFPYELSGYGLGLFIVWLTALVPLLALTVFDIRWQLLPTKLIRFLQMLGLINVAMGYFMQDSSLSRYIISVGAAVAVGAGVFYLLHVWSKGKWIGDGDVRFGVVIGLFTLDPLRAWLVIFVASLFGLFVSTSYIARRKKLKNLKIPFGPFLIFGLVISYLIGADIIDWYYSAFLNIS